jgi:cyanate permease
MNIFGMTLSIVSILLSLVCVIGAGAFLVNPKTQTPVTNFLLGIAFVACAGFTYFYDHLPFLAGLIFMCGLFTLMMPPAKRRAKKAQENP